MKIVRVTGTVTATIKAEGLIGHKFLIVNIENAAGDVIEQAHVAVDAIGAGIGDLCLMVEGSSARLPQAVSGLAVDAALIAVIDQVTS